ncbi:hypothetical protein V6N12_062817 [Hibiscus sabdariffa]|uniref:CCHC-type domain-containing protein n=1 Tax=Hibiscus sabdariffa TaxID=183260 RepID=A0ABR2F9Z1_9ROSI
MFHCIIVVLVRVVKIDYNTQEGGHNKFACLALILDLNYPLQSCIHIDGKLQRLEYEGLQKVCFACGIYGHAKEECQMNPIKMNSKPVPAGRDIESKLENVKLEPIVASKQKNTVATRGVSKNAAYLAFNPPKKSLKKGSTNFGAVVVPSVTSQSVVMVEHGTNVASGAHTVVKIMEDRFGKSSSRTGSGGNS